MKKEVKFIQDILTKNNHSACVIFGTDPHFSEYITNHYKFRDFVSGFTGSNGTLLILKQKAYLQTDSRYFLQAESELFESGIEILKMGIDKNYMEVLKENIKPGDTVISVFEAMDTKWAKDLTSFNINLKNISIDDVWPNRPKIDYSQIFRIKNYGIETEKKIENILKYVPKKHFVLFSLLDDIAYILNLRALDIPYNTTFYSFLLLSEDEKILFVSKNSLTEGIISYLEEKQIKIKNYEDVYNLDIENEIHLDFAKTNYKLFLSVKNPKNIDLTFFRKQKAIKQPEEIESMRKAFVEDGVALTNFFFFLANNKKNLSENELVDILHDFRSKGKNFVTESFETIMGFAKNGAVVHYNSKNQKEDTYVKEGCLLIDSGGQYFEGTTDITRTVYVRNDISDDLKDNFTRVLKGHINLSAAVFPKKTPTKELVSLVKSPLWQKGLNFNHGIGHGVGCFLGVHEGPFGIPSNEALEENVVISNEPGYYKSGEYGIRIESLILSKNHQDYKDFLCFETLTLCYIDKRLIKKDILSQSQIDWLDNYHKQVFEKLSPFLQEDVKNWLFEQTSPL